MLVAPTLSAQQNTHVSWALLTLKLRRPTAGARRMREQQRLQQEAAARGFMQPHLAAAMAKGGVRPPALSPYPVCT